MNQKNRQKEYFFIDFAYMFRCLGKNAFIMIVCACIVGMLSYIFLDNYQKDAYTVSVNVAVVARENTASKLTSSSINSAVNQCLNVLNSNILADRINRQDVEKQLSGSFKAIRVADTNIISLQATSPSAESAFRVLQAVIDNFPTLSSYFGVGYHVKTLGAVSAESIVVNHGQPGLYAIFAALLFLGAGVGLIGCFCLFTDVIHSKEQAEGILDTDILGTQHYIKKGKDQKAILITDEITGFSYVEEIEKLVTRLQGKMKAHKYKVLMVSSIKENEGKSTIVANIALCLAKRGYRVLLVDADLRRPALYKIFDKKVDENKQFELYLEGKATLEQCLYEDEEHSNMSFLLQEKAVAEPDKLLGNGSFKSVLTQMGEQVDYIIVDTPPIGIIRDAELIAGYADASLLVIRQDYVKGTVVNDVVDVLDETGTNVLGCAMTMVKGDKFGTINGSGYSGYYGYGYGYHHIHSKKERDSGSV